MDYLIIKWIGIAVCLAHSGMFSGLNLGFFGISRLKLEVKSENNDPNAKRILKLRKNTNFLLATILWGNVASNVLLTIITDSILSGLSAFIFSTFGITFFGEIVPQAYLSRSALKSSRILVPIVRFYQMILSPIARPTGILLDYWFGKESTQYFKEKEFKLLLKHHALAKDSDIEHTESQGAVNFLELDDIEVVDEGEIIDKSNTISLHTDRNGYIIFPDFRSNPNDPFLSKICESSQKWLIITSKRNKPKLVLNTHKLVKKLMCGFITNENIHEFCYKPIVTYNSQVKLEPLLRKFKTYSTKKSEDIIREEVILLWTKDYKKIITGSDILGRLLRGIVAK